MDDLSAEMFRRPAVKVAGYQEHEEDIRRACQTIFGRLLTPTDFAEFIAAPADSELLIVARRAGGDVELRLGYRWFNGTHDYILYKDQQSDKRVVEFESIAIQDAAPELLETRLFARQVNSFRKFAIDEIRLYAEGYPNHPGKIVGYYVWPRLGFIMDTAGLGSYMAQFGLESVDNTLDLFSQTGGAEWWYHHGSERQAVSYLHEGSPCLLALQSYLMEKGIS